MAALIEPYYSNMMQLIEQQCQKPKKSMNLKLLARKLLNGDIRTLIKAGVLNDDLSVENEDFVLQFVVNKFTKELAAEAKKHLDELKTEE